MMVLFYRIRVRIQYIHCSNSLCKASVIGRDAISTWLDRCVFWFEDRSQS